VAECNYTGPELSRVERDLLDARNEEERKSAVLELECDGILAHHTAHTALAAFQSSAVHSIKRTNPWILVNWEYPFDRWPNRSSRFRSFKINSDKNWFPLSKRSFLPFPGGTSL
jgi:hypothetical protein